VQYLRAAGSSSSSVMVAHLTGHLLPRISSNSYFEGDLIRFVGDYVTWLKPKDGSTSYSAATILELLAILKVRTGRRRLLHAMGSPLISIY
jgi:hypothetical protein